MKRKLRVYDHNWHLAHQYELLKNPNIDWFVQLNTYRKWEYTIRGKYLNELATPVAYYEPGKYDVAILHLDQSCINPRLGKSKLFREIDSVITDIPKIVIMHGTPMYEGYTEDLVKNGGDVKIPNSTAFEYWPGIKELVGDKVMVVNSHRSKERWGWGDTIWHGMSADEWWDLPKEPRVITMISPGGMSDDYYGRRLLEAVRNILSDKYGIKHQWVMNDYIPEQDCKRYHKNAFDSYRDFIGRSLIYFNPTGDSPMPRARTEAMLSGCCVITTNNHDEDMFIKPGINGFLVPKDAYAIADLIGSLIYDHPDEAIRMGQAGKETATKTFDVNRFSADWVKLIEKVLAGYTGKDQQKEAKNGKDRQTN